MAQTPPTAGFDYPLLLRGALLGLIRDLLRRVADEGFPGDHHFYLTFRTDAPGVVLSAAQRQRFPQEMTIVLQHQYWNLEVGDEAFSATLRFGGAPERLTIPFAALTGFVDPPASFGLRLDAAEKEGPSVTHEAPSLERPAPLPAQPEAPAAPSARTSTVVPFRPRSSPGPEEDGPR
jgi:hypothetical protein